MYFCLMVYAKNKNLVSKDGYWSWAFLHLGKSWLGDSQVWLLFGTLTRQLTQPTIFIPGIVNDMIFAYNIIMLIAWFFFNVVNVFSFLCVYSLYLELNDLTHLEDQQRLKVSRFLIINSGETKTQTFEPKSDWVSIYGIEVSYCRKSRLHDLEVTNT